MFQTKLHTSRVVDYKRAAHEPIVQSGLSVTPSQMEQMRQKGIPIAPPSLGVEFFDTDDNKNFYVDARFRRGADISDAYNAEQNARGKLKKAVLTQNQIDSYGRGD